jgi:hypothetical protein
MLMEGVELMDKFKATITINGIRTEVIVNAFDSYQARKLVEAQYAGQKIVWIFLEKIK